MRHESAIVVDHPAAAPLVLAGRSAAVAGLRAEIDAAGEAACLLLEGEPGLDVADIAREIHLRRGGPFIVVDCSAAAPAQVERELFGERRRPEPDEDLDTIDADSAMARARGGTLYLADVADLSAAAQSRLARLVRDREAVIGGITAAVDIRLVGSIVAEPDGDAEGSRLRRDLQKHFSRRRIAVPALRRRADDIPLLVEQVLEALSRHDRPAPPPVTHPAMTLLAAMPWKGNLVELRHAVARLAAGAAGGVIQLEDVLAHVRFDGSLAPPGPAGTLRAARQQFERDYIALVIRHHRGHMADAARALGIQRTNLYRKARQLGVPVARNGR
jgi:DNA-binding NtrC family response regulator